MITTFQQGIATVPGAAAMLSYREGLVTKGATQATLAEGMGLLGLGGLIVSDTVAVSAAEVLALNAMAKVILAAPGAGLAIIPHKVAIRKAAGTAYAGVAAGEDLVLRYTNASGVICSDTIETTGFLDSTSQLVAFAGRVNNGFLPTANAAVVLHLLVGEVITGDCDLEVKVWYEIFDTTDF